MNAANTLPIPTASLRSLSEQLERLRQTFADRRATIREVIDLLETRAFALLMILFALPFIAPVSLPGSSTPLGLIVAIISVQMAFGRLPWLPRRIQDWRLPAGFFTKVIPVAQRIVRRLEKVLHPRWLGLTALPWVRGLHLLTVCMAGLLLALPMPIPLTNTFPGWTILLLACGLLERDGMFVAAGYGVFLATLMFFGLLSGAISEALTHSWHWLAG